MREYKCKKDFYTEDVKFASAGDIVRLLQDGTTAVNLSDKQKVLYAPVMLDNKNHFTEITEDNVNRPKHYTSHPSGIECIEVTRHYCFAIGNAIKYLWRAGLKKDAGLEDRQKEIEDLNKAIWYIKDRINQLENEN